MLSRRPQCYSYPQASLPIHSLRMLLLRASPKTLPFNPKGPPSNRNKRGSKTRNATKMFMSVAIGRHVTATTWVTAPRAEPTTTAMIPQLVEVREWNATTNWIVEIGTGIAAIAGATLGSTHGDELRHVSNTKTAMSTAAIVSHGLGAALPKQVIR